LRRLLKFLHTVGAAGLTGAVAALAVLLIFAPASMATPGSGPMLIAMAKVAAWIIGPSMALTVASGLLAMLATPAFQDKGWVWAKAATGILVLQAGLHVLGPLQEEARRAANVLADDAHKGGAARLFEAEVNTLWLLLAVSIANFALGIWRPRFPRYPV
jgi:uncharacterized membrane protein